LPNPDDADRRSDLPLVKAAFNHLIPGNILLTQNKNNVAILELRRLVGISYRAPWRLKHKLVQVMYEREQSSVLSERVEVDDAYLGGELPGGKAGRGSENKVPFIAAVQTNKQGHPLYAVFSPVKSFCREEVELWARQYLAPSSLVVTEIGN
jgi:hypothetical protein